jgi:hypothetical protein
MKRRNFLGLLGALPFLDPERLLWVPGEKKIFIPSISRPPPEEWTVKEINEITRKYITPGLVDSMFQPDQFLEYLWRSQKKFQKEWHGAYVLGEDYPNSL